MICPPVITMFRRFYQSSRHFCSSRISNRIHDSVDLFYRVYASDCGSTAVPLVVTHGLLGSTSNWHTLSKKISERSGRNVFNLDARNHGNSPHTEKMDYQLMAADVAAIMRRESIKRATLIGHSMGGRTMMTLALSQPELVEKLIVVDVSPFTSADRRISSDVADVVKALCDVKIPSVSSQMEARKLLDSQLQSTIPDKLLRQFLLTNLVENENKTGVCWRLNLPVIRQCLPELSRFNIPPVSTTNTRSSATNSCFSGDTLFVGGGNSNYIRREDQDGILRVFPSAEFVWISDAGHWVHSDQPTRFLNTVCPFIATN